jgi:hypothetical protein
MNLTCLPPPSATPPRQHPPQFLARKLCRARSRETRQRREWRGHSCPGKGAGGLGVAACGFDWGLGFSLTRLHVSCARVADGPYVEEAVQAELHALILEQVNAGVGAWQVHYDLPLLKTKGGMSATEAAVAAAAAAAVAAVGVGVGMSGRAPVFPHTRPWGRRTPWLSGRRTPSAAVPVPPASVSHAAAHPSSCGGGATSRRCS